MGRGGGMFRRSYLQFRRAGRHGAARRDTGRQEGRAPDRAAFAEDCLSSQDDGVSVDRHVVPDGWVAFIASDHATSLVLEERQGAERDTLIELDVVADLRRL